MVFVPFSREIVFQSKNRYSQGSMAVYLTEFKSYVHKYATPVFFQLVRVDEGIALYALISLRIFMLSPDFGAAHVQFTANLEFSVAECEAVRVLPAF